MNLPFTAPTVTTDHRIVQTASWLPEISVVVPVYRNAETLPELHHRLRAVLTAQESEIIFVNDACPADSLSVLKKLSAMDAKVVVLSLQKNGGQHRALLAGLSQARGQKMVMMDADLQDLPEALPQLLTRLDAGYGAVFAGRRGNYESAGRLLTSRFFKWLMHRLCGLPMDAGLFVAMSREMAAHLLSLAERRPYLPAMMACAGLPLCSIPVMRKERAVGSSAYSSWKRLKTGGQAVLCALRLKYLPRRNKKKLRLDVSEKRISL